MAKFLDSNGLVFFKTLIENFVNNGFVAKVSGKGLSTNDYTTAEKEKLAGIATGADANVNADWNATSGDAQILNKPTVPTKLSEMTADTTHRTVTDAEKTAWNGKSDFTGSYNDLTEKPAIPTKLSEMSADTTHRTVTDAEKAAWNAKSNFTGSYNDLSDKPTIPTTVASLSDAGNYALKSDLSNVYTYKGSVATVDKLPTNATSGDVYNVEANGANYAWNGTAWDNLGGEFTVEAIPNTEIEAMFA